MPVIVPAIEVRQDVTYISDLLLLGNKGSTTRRRDCRIVTADGGGPDVATRHSHRVLDRNRFTARLGTCPALPDRAQDHLAVDRYQSSPEVRPRAPRRLDERQHLAILLSNTKVVALEPDVDTSQSF